MVERREIYRQNPAVGLETRVKEPTLRESLVGTKGKLSKDYTRVARMLNFLDISLEQKRHLFFYHLWHETGSLAPIKMFVEIRDDFTEVILGRVLGDDNLVGEYDKFYKRYTEHKKEGSKAYKRRVREIVSLREKLNAPEIAKVTGHSEDYVRSVFKRLIKQGKIKRMSKREVVEKKPEYAIYIKIREGVQELRNSNKKYTEQEIADLLTDQLDETITKQQVKRQIRMLIKDGEIKKRTKS